jgi:hypothetical protein
MAMLRHGRALSLAIAALLAIGVQQLGCSSDPGAEPDTDGDGLSDAEELNVTDTSPLMADTDGDGLSDFQEAVTLGFDPNNDPLHFNPRVADLPEMIVQFVGPPILVFQWMDAKGTTYTLEQDLAATYTTGATQSVSPMQMQADTNSVSQTNMNEVSVTEPIGGVSSSASGSGGSSGGSGGSASGSSSGSTSGSASTSSGSASSSGSSGSSGADASPGDAASGDPATDDDDDDDDAGARDAARRDGAVDAAVRPVRDSGAAADANVVVDSGEGGDAGASSSSGGGSSGSSSGASITFTNSVATTVNPSETVAASITYTNEQNQDYSETLTHIRSIAANDTFTVTGAFLKTAAVIHNPSDVGFRVANVLIGSQFLDPSGLVLAVQNLFIDEGELTSYVPFSLAPGEDTTPITFVTMLLSMDTAVAVLQRWQQLVLDLATYELDDATGKAFSFNLDAVFAKTALVAIDYGPQRAPEVFQVATNSNPAHPGVTAATIFNDILRIPYTASPETGLTAVRDFMVTTSGGPRWSALRLHKVGPDMIRIPFGQNGMAYDFDDIRVYAGDVLALSFGTSDTLDNPDAGVAPPSLGSGPAGDGGLSSYNPDAAPEVPTQYPDADRALQLPPDDSSAGAPQFPSPSGSSFGQGFPSAATGPPGEGGPPAVQP